jgi:aspartyl-tRNA(Asn)/glutamyl-tRNA(Gln) amidotransferase subunit C
MALTKQDVAWVAHLARLELSEEMTEKMTAQLRAVLDYIAKLDELNTDGVEPLSHPGALYGVFREDDPAESLDRTEVLRNAPDEADGCFRVPRVIE